ncbi:Acyl-CoA synthetase (AMP-forming)/AMP-acid ligase II [Micromonospora coxensis]|uniref:Acyl-CoA synthetase (AMP-forming)/AMP-acid ligase II n=2 Tax=Micromonospora coxensis TaxID=356852 RepID=A0A1C5K2I8_9ACTN|nr:AMP-binding protein [Micromonospora coxensis]SCG77002.1 Acyl-CoA synthetase (AMP-forming)/AMP-acid ligase II [Micromonospora coxensis]
MAVLDVESRIQSICWDVLKRSDLGLDHDLMEAGMDSLAAVEIVTRVELDFGVDVVDAIFETPTVRQLAALVRRSARDDGSAGPAAGAPAAWQPPDTRNFLDLIAAAADRYGDRPYLLQADGEARDISFAEVLAFTRGCAALLDEHGVPPGGRVAMVLHNSSLAALLFLGVVGAQRVLVPLNPKSGPAELEAQLAHAEPALVLGRQSTSTKLSPGTSWLSVDDEAGFIGNVLTKGAGEPGRPSALDSSGELDAVVVYTSGSTGTPKGVVLSHRSLISGAVAMAEWAKAGEDDVFLNVNPLFHAGGQMFPTLTPLWCGGRSVCVRSEAALARFWTYVDRFQPTWTLVVNAYLAHLAEKPERPAARSLQGVLAGGSPLSPALIHRFESTFGIPVYQVYGMTELATITTVEPRDRKPGDTRTAGLPVACSQVRVVGLDGSDVPAGDNGEVLLTGANLFTRYENAPELTAERLRDGWIHTGDLGQLDAGGELTIVDRLDSMVIVNGENVYPAEIESVVPHLAGIEDAVVTALPHPVTGVELVLVYKLLPSAAADEDVWRATLLKHVSTFKVPRRFVALKELDVEEFPRTPLGKIVRPDVQRLAVEHLS